MYQDTDFLEAGGPDAYAWNLIRSEFDDLLFRHAGTCGAHILSETKVDTIHFEPDTDGIKSDSNENSNGSVNPGRPVSATWVRKDGTSGSVTYKYLVDASGRHGILSTKYLKNRKFNNNFKNAAIWAYWKTDNVYGPGTHMEGSPYFEALDGEFSMTEFTYMLPCWRLLVMNKQTLVAGLGSCHYTMVLALSALSKTRKWRLKRSES
jgi:flavin-dependent dehydrogenase